MTKFVFDIDERTAVFIDGASLYNATRSLNFELDYAKLNSFFRKETNFLRSYYYSALVESDEYTPKKPLMDFLEYNGFSIVSKTVREHFDAQSRRRVNGSMDVELAVDMLCLCDKINHAVLMSGDANFVRLVKAVQERGVRVTVISTMVSNPVMIADDLRRQADQFIDLFDLKALVAREPAKSPVSARSNLVSDTV